MTSEDLLSVGIAAAKAGDLQKAQALLAQALRDNLNSEEGWLWLGRVCPSTEERSYCFKRVLALNPQNAEAIELLNSPGSVPPLRPSKRPEAMEDSKPVQPAAFPPEGEPIQTPNASSLTPAVLSPEDSGPAKASSKRLEKILLSILGFMLAILFCGGGLIYFERLPQFDQLAVQVGAIIRTPTPTIPTSTPSITATPSNTTTPSNTLTFTPSKTRTRTATLTPSLTSNPTLLSAKSDMFVSQAESLMQEEKYAEAIAKLDEAITLDPGNGQAYFDRASSYFALTSHQRSFGEFLDYLQQARADIDRAIALGPAIGDYYIKRQYIYNTLAYSQVYRVDFIRLEEIALENSRIANQLGNTEQDSDRDPPAALFSLNRCEEGLAETRQLIAARGADTPPSEGLDTMLAKGYLCQGKLDQALEYINSAIELAPMWGRSWTKIIILYNMGRLDGALAMLNESITNDPYYVGDRYFLRAAIYADQGKLAEAEADIKFGSGQTWERNGIASYAEALAALGRGDHISALEKFQDAEATINYDYGPLLKRIQREIASLGGHLITVTPQPFLSTPIDTPQVTATQHFTSTKKFSTPTSSTTTPVPPPEAATFPLELGTGPITLESGDNSVFHFKPLAPIKFTRIVSLTFRMIPINDNQNASILQLMPWNLKDGGWGLVDNLKWSDNSIPNYRNYVSPEGDIYTSLRNWGAVGVNFQNMGFILLVELDDGSQVTYGLK